LLPLPHPKKIELLELMSLQAGCPSSQPSDRVRALENASTELDNKNACGVK